MTLLSIFVLAVLVEAIIEYLGKPIPSAYKPFAAAALSIVVCIAYGADLLALLGLEAQHPVAGQVLTGLVIGRGSNYLNDLWQRIKTVPAPAMSVDEVPM